LEDFGAIFTTIGFNLDVVQIILAFRFRIFYLGQSHTVIQNTTVEIVANFSCLEEFLDKML
jgi:hypothetical protein